MWRKPSKQEEDHGQEKVPYDSNGVMAVSAVLTADGETVGVLRFISSLRGVDEDVRSVSRIFIIIGAVVAVISILLSFLLSSTIVDPLKKGDGCCCPYGIRRYQRQEY